MTHTISIRTISIFAAIIGLLAIVLMTAQGNPAQGQSLPTVGFEDINVSVDEPDQSPYRVNAILTVQLSQASSQNVSVRYQTVDITAKAAERDYNAASGTLYFNPGITERTISVPVLNDTVVERTERFRLELFQANGAILNTSRDAVNILIEDVDQSAPYNLIAPATVREDQGTFTVIVETASTPIVNKVAYLYIDALPGTAHSGTHYRPVSEVLTFNKGETRKTFQVEVINNTTDHPDKSFSIRMAHNGTGDDQIVLGTTLVTVTIQDDDPAVPTNLEIIENRTDPDLDHVAVLQWDYSDAEGYLLESRDGTTEDWNCIVAGTYSSNEPTGTSTVSTTKGGAMAASSNWHFRVRNFTSQEFSYPGEATCDENADEDGKPDYGYIFSTVEDQGYNLSPAETLGPVAIPAIDPTVRPTWQPTGLTIAAGAKHRDVQISWDEPPAGSNVTGFALYRKWQGDSNAPHLCLYWSTKPSEFITSYRDYAIAAYETADEKNKYTYTVYPLNDAVPQNLSAPGGCDDYKPGAMQPQASVTATLAISTDIFPNSEGDLEYLNPPAPTGLTLTSKLSSAYNHKSLIRIDWQDLPEAPGYKVRYRESGETSWREHSRYRRLETKKTTGNPHNNCTGVPRFDDDAAESRGVGVEERELSGQVDGKIRVWCIRENGKLLTTKANTWPRMYNAGPGKHNDDIAGTSRRISLLDQNQQHEVQVATCTDQSCGTIGAWSASSYAYSR